MDDYTSRGQERILRDLKFREEQVDLLGRLLSLQDSPDLVRSIDIQYTHLHVMGQPALQLESPRTLSVNIGLTPAAMQDDHDGLMDRIRRELGRREIPADGLFSYCNKSYGLEVQGFDIHLSQGQG